VPSLIQADLNTQRLQHGTLLGLEDPLERQVHHVGAVVVHLPLEDREVGLGGRGVVEDGRQPAAVRMETLSSPRGNVPGDVE
jgi:hypothetical protein